MPSHLPCKSGTSLDRHLHSIDLQSILVSHGSCCPKYFDLFHLDSMHPVLKFKLFSILKILFLKDSPIRDLNPKMVSHEKRDFHVSPPPHLLLLKIFPLSLSDAIYRQWLNGSTYLFGMPLWLLQMKNFSEIWKFSGVQTFHYYQ